MKLILGQPNKKTPHLQGKTVVNLFYENSTRTRLSFELAAKYMSANAANITASRLSLAVSTECPSYCWLLRIRVALVAGLNPTSHDTS